jgi:hypothetical protein
MKAFFGILIFSWVLTLFMPWWSLFIPALLIGAWLINRGLTAFLIGFCGTGFAWFIQAFYIHLTNDGILTGRIGDMMGAGSPLLVLFITFIIGGIPGGLGALTGYLVKINLKRQHLQGVAGR